MNNIYLSAHIFLQPANSKQVFAIKICKALETKAETVFWPELQKTSEYWAQNLDHFLLPCSVYWIIRTDLTQLKRLKLNFHVVPFFETIDFVAFLLIVRNLPWTAGLYVIKRFS